MRRVTNGSDEASQRGAAFNGVCEAKLGSRVILLPKNDKTHEYVVEI